MQPSNYGYYDQTNVISHDDPIIQKSYREIAAIFPDARFVMAGDVVRFERKCLMNWLCDNTSLTNLRIAYLRRQIPRDEYMKFYQDIGYSLSGFWDVFTDEIDEMYAKICVDTDGFTP